MPISVKINYNINVWMRFDCKGSKNKNPDQNFDPGHSCDYNAYVRVTTLRLAVSIEPNHGK